MSNLSRGFIYIAYGANAEREAKASIASLRMYNRYPVAVICDGGFDDAIVTPMIGRGARGNKVSLYDLSPFDLTVYIDADTRIKDDLSPIFDILEDGWDMCITPSTCQGSRWLWHAHYDERTITERELGWKPMQLQAGMFGFCKNDRVKEFFTLWRKEWERFGWIDQGAFLRALYNNPLRIWLLGRDWNGGTIIEHRFGAI